MQYRKYIKVFLFKMFICEMENMAGKIFTNFDRILQKLNIHKTKYFRGQQKFSILELIFIKLCSFMFFFFFFFLFSEQFRIFDFSEMLEFCFRNNSWFALILAHFNCIKYFFKLCIYINSFYGYASDCYPGSSGIFFNLKLFKIQF